MPIAAFAPPDAAPSPGAIIRTIVVATVIAGTLAISDTLLLPA
jgi:hypothetical protein